MEKARVYFTDFRVKVGSDGLLGKLKQLMKLAGIEKLDLQDKYVAIKMHFGELGNLSFLRPNYARAVVELVKELGGKPFLTDCNTLYPGSRKDALEHLNCAWLNGFTPLSVGCPILIGDGLKGTDEVAVPVVGGEYIKEAFIGHAIMDADVILSLTHFKGHEMAGFGGAIKNLGMGCGSRAGKRAMHNSGKATIAQALCRGCRRCARECANNGLVFDEEKQRMRVDENNCVGCGRCIGACNFDAIHFSKHNAPFDLNCRMAEYAKAVVDGRESLHVSLIMDVSPNCDCHRENDAPILPNIGMLASLDPVALDRACADLCMKAKPMENSQLGEYSCKPDFVDLGDPFRNNKPDAEWRSCLEHGEKIGLGTQDYELIVMK